MSNPKVEKCGTCRGAGYHFYGTGTDATCEECGGIGHMPAYSPPATRAIDGEKLLGWIGNNGFGVRSLDYSLSTFRDALTKEIESGAFDIDLSDPTARRIVALHGELGEKEAQLNQALEALEMFVSNNFKGGSKADRPDYGVMVPASDIFHLRQTLQSIKGDGEG